MNLVITPPVAFIIVLLAAGWMYMGLRVFALKPKTYPRGLVKPYSCGEDLPEALVQPDYGQFFPFAFFFTILHVVALMVTTVPVEQVGSFLMAVLYVVGALVALLVLYKR